MKIRKKDLVVLGGLVAFLGIVSFWGREELGLIERGSGPAGETRVGADVAKQTTRLVMTVANKQIPIGGTVRVEARLTDGSGRPINGEKIVLAYDGGWNYGVNKRTDGDGRVVWDFRLANEAERTGFCGRGGSGKVPARYQIQAYFQGSATYLGNMARANIEVINQGEVASGGPVTIEGSSGREFTSVPPLIYYGWDYSNRDPATMNYGPFGSIYYQLWEELDGGNLSNYLNRANGMKLRLVDGSEINKPVIHGVYFYDSTGDRSSTTVKSQIGSYSLAPAGCKVLTTPKYCDPAWQNSFREMVYDLGRNFDGKVAGELISFGFEGEAVNTKNLNGCNYKAELEKVCSEYEFKMLLRKVVGWYREAFPTTPLFVQAAPYDINYNLSLSPPVGYKTNNWTNRSSNQWAYSNIKDESGESRAWYAYPDLPRGFESKYGAGLMGGEAGSYWMIMDMLGHNPDFIDFHEDHWNVVSKNPWLADLVSMSMQRKAESAPVAWTLLTEIQDVAKKENYSCQISGVYGDYSHYIYRKENIAGNNTRAVSKSDLPGEAQGQIYTNPSDTHLLNTSVKSPSYSGRITEGGYMSFDVDNGWRSASSRGQNIRLNLVYLDKGTDDFWVEYYDGEGQKRQIEIKKTGTNRWVRKEGVALSNAYLNDQFPGETDIRIDDRGDGKEIIHLVELWAGESVVVPTGGPGLEGNATPTVRPTVRPTSSPRPTTISSPRPTMTPTEGQGGLVCRGGCYSSSSNCETNCGKPCMELTGQILEDICSWPGEYTGYKCCEGALPTTVSACQRGADGNRDGKVNLSDYELWRKEYVEGRPNASDGNWKGDFDCDGGVDLDDLIVWQREF